jgi:fimbrial chaperone protein
MLSALSATGASFSVSPVRIYMQSRERATAITIVNEGDSEVVMQADLFEWKQKADGTDELTPTEDLILAPPILKLAPKSQQVLRLANLRPVPPGDQLTYRMIVRELPEALPQQPGVQIQVALAFSLPIFITPPGATSRLTCAAKRNGADAITAFCENTGRAYAQAMSFVLRSATGETLLSQEVSGGYVLPQVKRQFELKRTAAGPALAGAAKLAVTQDDGSVQSFDVLLAD